MWIRNVYPGSQSRIQQQQQKRRGEKIGFSSFLVATNVIKLLKIIGVACEIRDPGVKQALGITDPDPQHCRGLDLRLANKNGQHK